jgi:type IV pilus assembly protein PilM
MLTRTIPMPKLPRALGRLLQDPPPQWVLEFSETGVLRASTGDVPETRWQPMAEGALVPSPVDANFRNYDAVVDAVQALELTTPQHRESACALLLPDYSVRVSVLDFDQFPSALEEQEPLVRFRLRKIVPYELDSARLSFEPYALPEGGHAVVASVCPLHVLAEYESCLRKVHCKPGFISSSTLSAVSLLPEDEVCVLAKWAGKVASVVVLQQGIPRLFRTVEMQALDWDELLALLHPTLATVEDRFLAKVGRLFVCGEEMHSPELSSALEREFGIAAEALQSPFGSPSASSAGALGYIMGMKELGG